MGEEVIQAYQRSTHESREAFMLTEQEARQKVKSLKRFYMDLTSYAVVNALLLLIWLVFDQSGTFWPQYVIVIWGFAVLAKAYWSGLFPFFFGQLSFLTPEWEDKKVNELLEKPVLQRKVFLKRDSQK